MTHEEGRRPQQDPTSEERSGDERGTEQPAEERPTERSDGETEGGAVSEGGSGALNPDTSLGGADSVPDTPDVNTEISDRVDTSEPGQKG